MREGMTKKRSNMSIYIDYNVDHDLDTSSIKNMILDLESRLGYRLHWAHESSSEIRKGFVLFWNGYYDEQDNYIECYDENICQPIDAVRLFYYKDGYRFFEMHCFSHVFGIWHGVDECRFPCAFGWFTFLRFFLGCPSENIPRNEQVRQDTYKVLQFYKEVLEPFHPTTFVAHGEEDSWIGLAEDGKCALKDLLNYRIDGKYKPIPVNKDTAFTYGSDYGTEDENVALVFVERFDYAKKDSLWLTHD